jgi:chemotaxis protein methyltransferase WspC
MCSPPAFCPAWNSTTLFFCRNLLIYFDRATQDRVIEALARLLRPQGFLFIGPSESGLLLSHGFVSAKLPLAFAFRKGAAASPEPAPGIAHALKRPPAARPRAPSLVAPKPSRVRPAGQAVVSPPNPPTLGLDEAERLANQGRLAEAAKHCEAHVREHGPSAEALYLLGLVRDANGSQAQAIETYRKALYLDPNHHEALVHLALLLAKQGDTAGAQVLQQRGRRLQQKSGK